MMADTGIGRILPTEVISPIQSYDRGTGSLHEDVGALRRERTLSVGQGVKEAKNAAQDWIDELGTMDWPADWALPNWRHVTIAAADCLALRIIDHSPGR